MRTPLLLAIAACALQGGCVAAGALGAATVGMTAVQDRTMGRAIDDAAGSSEVKTRLLALDRQAYLRVDVEMAEGQMLLSGTVPTNEHKAMAERIAWGVRSVESVSNQIEVGRNAGVVRSAMDNAITARVRTKLLSDSRIKGVNFNIETQKGVVYLMGLARSDEELQRAAEAASTVGGVERVVSYVEVRPVDAGVRQSAARHPDAEVPEQPGLGAPIVSATN